MLRKLIPIVSPKVNQMICLRRVMPTISQSQSLRSFYSSSKKSSSFNESTDPSPPKEPTAEPIATEAGESGLKGEKSEHCDGSKGREMEQKMRTIQEAYLQQLADMENLRSRTKKEVENASHFSIHSFSKDLVSVVDILEIALRTAPANLPAEGAEDQSSAYNNLHEGVRMMLAELMHVLKRHGIEQFNPLHEKFDPNLHNALYQVNTEEFEPGTVVSVEKLGYFLKGRLLRPASVGVSTK